jgi:hypothetical protein
VLITGIPTIKMIDLSKTQIGDDALEALSVRGQRLTTLNLSGCSNFTEYGLRTVLIKCTRLHTLELKSTKISQSSFRDIVDLGVDASLTSLNLSSCKRFSDVQFDLPTLQVLNMSNLPHLTTLNLNCSSLVQLNIPNNRLLRVARFECPQLQNLNLSGCGLLAELTAEAPNLLELNMYGCRTIPEASLDLFFNSTLELKRLSLKGMIQISDAIVTSIVERSKGLVEFDISGCKRLSARMVDYVVSNFETKA